MLTALSIICIIWAIFTNYTLATSGAIPIPFTSREQGFRIILGIPIRLWYLLISHLACFAGSVYIYFTYF